MRLPAALATALLTTVAARGESPAAVDLSALALSIQRLELGSGRRAVIDPRAGVVSLALCTTGASGEPPALVRRTVLARGGRLSVTEAGRCVEVVNGELRTAVWAARSMAPRARVLSLVGDVDPDEAARLLREAYADAPSADSAAAPPKGAAPAGVSWPAPEPLSEAAQTSAVTLALVADALDGHPYRRAGRVGLELAAPVDKAKLRQLGRASEADVTRARRRAELAWLAALSSNARRAELLGLAERERGDARHLVRFVQGLRDVTSASVRARARAMEITP
jgi:hypothetical protein